MRKSILFVTLAAIFGSNAINAQDNQESRVITTGVPFLLIAADARSAGMGEQGVATSPDAYSQQWNPAKYAFIEQSQGVGVNYTPYLSQLVNDIFLGQLTYYNRLNERSAVGASFRYFSLGEVELRQTADELGITEKPNEFTFDLSYSLRLSDQFSMAVAGRYLRSDLRIPDTNGDASAAGSFGVDIAGYYQSEAIVYNDFDGRWHAGFNISNIGPKIKYDDAGQENFIPTNLRLGGGFDFILDPYNTINVGLEFNKLLVPSPGDLNGDGVYDTEDAQLYNDIGFFNGIFKSFGDAQDGFSEEIKEVTWSLGAEYVYNDAFSLRTGYFNESDMKGSRKFATLGLGFKYTTIDIDVSYLFSTSNVRNPLENTLRFGITFGFGDEYTEY
ncbi:type IX secretion system outer membrane channel protein PorV [Leeuwenhoekiella sp. A16]|uniref:type IX secretion system outer membrane channel protein PorV n=1 Tax=unclassified Leeuwenhoekiella TaxID=2615029 RepID=UPI003A813249|tara:strand:+ start:19541 stop:20701 length:1161 start_codon:yes stop_codon:yes gene_type:complete